MVPESPKTPRSPDNPASAGIAESAANPASAGIPASASSAGSAGSPDRAGSADRATSGAERGDRLDRSGATQRVNVRAGPRRQVDGKGADAASGADDEHVAGLHEPFWHAGHKKARRAAGLSIVRGEEASQAASSCMSPSESPSASACSVRPSSCSPPALRSPLARAATRGRPQA